MKRKIICSLVCALMIATILPVTGAIIDFEIHVGLQERQEREYGEAPEGAQAIAYPSLGVMGSFPTCKCCGPASWIEHNNFGGYFGPGVDFEPEGNGGFCPHPAGFPPYDKDETYQDGDAGLIMPEPFTIDNSLNVVPFSGYTGTPLGSPGQTAVWGVDVDIFVHNTMPNHEPYVEGYVNVLIDFNQNGIWSDIPGEHVLINFYIPPLYIGPLSGLSPPSFTIGPNSGYVWSRFTITERPVQTPWMGDGGFEDGESEDYLLLIKDECEPSIDVEKYVWDPDNNDWVDADTQNDALDLEICTNAKFKIVIHNNGECCDLTNIKVNDKMHDSLKYISADPEPDEYYYEPPEYFMKWNFPGPLEPCNTIEIEIIAHVEGPECSTDYNYVEVIGHSDCDPLIVTDDDWAYVHAYEKSRTVYTPFLNWLQNYLNMFPMLQLLLQRLEL